MAPATYTRGVYRSQLAGLLMSMVKEGRVSMGCPIETSEGTRVADVVWASTAFLKKHGLRKLSLPESPEIVVEIESPSNSTAELLEEKRHLYLEAGAREF